MQAIYLYVCLVYIRIYIYICIYFQFVYIYIHISGQLCSWENDFGGTC